MHLGGRNTSLSASPAAPRKRRLARSRLNFGGTCTQTQSFAIGCEARLGSSDLSGDPISDFMKELDRDGELDVDNLEDAVVWLHGVLSHLDVNPEDPNTYRALVVFATLIRSYKPFTWAVAMNEIVRISLRALRDLNRRGDGR